jgi:hypothetical protein
MRKPSNRKALFSSLITSDTIKSGNTKSKQNKSMKMGETENRTRKTKPKNYQIFRAKIKNYMINMQSRAAAMLCRNFQKQQKGQG